jgi:hypothetical protein
MKTAAEGWQNLSTAERQGYNDRVSNERKIYLKEMAGWKAYRNGLKKPATAYGLFVRVVWNVRRRKLTKLYKL